MLTQRGWCLVSALLPVVVLCCCSQIQARGITSEQVDLAADPRTARTQSPAVISIGVLGPAHAFEYRTAARITWLHPLVSASLQSARRSQVVYRFVIPSFAAGTDSWPSFSSLQLENATYGDIVAVPCDNMAELPLKWLQISAQTLPAFFHAIVSVNSYMVLDKMLEHLVSLPRDNVMLARLQHTTACSFSTCNSSDPGSTPHAPSSCSCMRVYKGWDTEAPDGPDPGTAPTIEYHPDTLLPVELGGDVKVGQALLGACEHEHVCQGNKGLFARPFWAPLSPSMILSANVVDSIQLTLVQSQLCEYLRYGTGSNTQAGYFHRTASAAILAAENGEASSEADMRQDPAPTVQTATQRSLAAANLALMAGMVDIAYLLNTQPGPSVVPLSSKYFMMLGRDMEFIEDVYRLENAVLVQRLNNATTMRLLHRLLGPSDDNWLHTGDHTSTPGSSINIMLQLHAGAHDRVKVAGATEQTATIIEQNGVWLGMEDGQAVRPIRRVRLGMTILVSLGVFHVVVVVGLWVYVHRTMMSATKKYDQRHVSLMYAALWGANAAPQGSSKKGLLGRY